MIGLDSNVLLRFVVGDDPEQARAARTVMAGLTPKEPGFISLVTLVEFAWVLARGYRRSPEQVLDHVEDLLASAELEFEDGETVWRALAQARSGADLADAIVADTAETFGCSETVTFDRRAARLLGMRLL